MGAAPSREPVAPAIEEKLAERLHALQLQRRQEADGEYVHVDAHPPKYSSHEQSVSFSKPQKWLQELMEDPKNRLAMAALTANNADSILNQRAVNIKDTQTFNVTIPLEGAPVTNQRSSGRCWLFATTNVLRIPYMRKFDIKHLELSQSYLFFWDKIEKANYFLEQMLETADEPLDGRLVQELLSAPVNDGGQWDMAANLIRKYGLVPQSLYPDSFNAKSSAAMDRLITTRLREDGLKLRALSADHPDKVGAAKDEMLQEIHLILTLMLGPPPNPKEQFTWEYYDSKGKFHDLKASPLKFASILSSSDTVRSMGGTNVTEMFSLVNDPRNEYNRLLSVSRLGNVREGRPVTYVNVDSHVMQAAAISMLKSGLPIFFGSDVGKYSNSQSGIMDTDLVKYELAFNIKLGMNKAQRLRTKESAMTHAMVLTAVHVTALGTPIRWRVENSWGEDAGSQGYFVMSNEWFHEFVYQVVVDPKYVTKDIREVLKQEPKMLPLWDPMGALA